MGESGGPIFEGSSKPFKEKLSATADRVRERVVNRLKQNTGEIVEQKWMDAYQRVVDATDPGLRKKALEKLQFAAKGWAKLNRGGAAAMDIVGIALGPLVGIYGLKETIRPNEAVVNYFGDKNARLLGVGNMVSGITSFFMGKERIARVASGWLADITGAGAEKYVQIQNKILNKLPKFGGKPKPMAV